MKNAHQLANPAKYSFPITFLGQEPEDLGSDTEAREVIRRVSRLEREKGAKTHKTAGGNYVPKHINVFDYQAVDKDPEARFIQVVYNQYSLDSKLGAAIYASAMRMRGHNVALQRHDRMQSVAVIQGVSLVVLMGIELLDEDLRRLLDTTKVTSFGYRGYNQGDTWRAKASQKQRENMKFIKANYGEEMEPAHYKLTNSVSWLVRYELMQLCQTPHALWDYVNDVANYTNLVIMDGYDLSKPLAQRQPAKLANLLSLDLWLSSALERGDTNVQNYPESGQITPEMCALRSRQIRQDLHANVRQELYAHRNKHVKMPTLAVRESEYQSVLHHASQSMSGLVTYEDVRDVRIWRVYSKNPAAVELVIGSLKANAVWHEGLVTLAATAVPQLNK